MKQELIKSGRRTLARIFLIEKLEGVILLFTSLSSIDLKYSLRRVSSSLEEAVA